MPPPPRAIEALEAMKNLGFSRKVAGPVLKKLLKAYDQNWEYIEENGYQVLIDSILEEQESMALSGKTQDAADGVEPEHRGKRLRKVGETDPSSSMIAYDSPVEALLKKPKLEPDLDPEASNVESGAEPVSQHIDNSGKTTLPILPHPSPSSERAKHDSSPINPRETRASSHAGKSIAAQEMGEAGSLLAFSRDNHPAGDGSGSGVQENRILGSEVLLGMSTSTRSNDREADDNLPEFADSIAMILPPNHPVPTRNKAHQYERSQDDSAMGDIQRVKFAKSLATENGAHVAGKVKGIGVPSNIVPENGKISEVDTSREASSTTIDIASSDMGKVKLLFRFSSDGPDVRIPSLDAVLQMVQERCLKCDKILQPDFSLLNVLKEMCQCALELSNEPNNDIQENIGMETHAAKKCDVRSTLAECPLDGFQESHGVHGNRGTDKSEKGKGLRYPESSNFSPHTLVVAQQPQIAHVDLRPPHDPNDITKGQERVRIPLVNEVSNEKYPSSFQYIPRSIVHQNACVNISLTRIGDEDCCSDCFGDCLAAAAPCACAQVTGCEFAYTSDGLVKETILDECYSINREPQKHQLVYCQDCPSERCKDEAMVENCKGHLVRKFIKECWSKCGCSMQCNNRVVQRGITCNLQVFFTPEGKGWGLRTLDELPRGTFVCEYVGEVLTNMELYNRRAQSIDNAKYALPVLLDADWGSKGMLKDEEALCLDATFYGNVARFVNHRCVDANLTEIPVEVETPDHHYYHVAFFTTRKIQQFEELTWDYGIDFHDAGNPVKAFKCRCGSKFCRDMKRSKTRTKALVSR